MPRALLLVALSILGLGGFAVSAEDAAERTFLHAEGLLQEGKVDEAREAFRRVAEGFPRSALADDALLRMARLDFPAESPDLLTQDDAAGAAAAMPLLTTIRQKYPGADRAPDARYLQGLVHLVPGAAMYDPDRSYAAFREVIDVHPGAAVAPAALRGAAYVEMRAGRAGRALLYLERLLLEHPTGPEAERARLDAADAYLRLGRPREAMIQLLPLRLPGTSGPASEAALDLASILLRLDLPGAAPEGAFRFDPDYPSSGPDLRQISSMVFDGAGDLHLLARDGKELVRLDPGGRSEGRAAIDGGRCLFRQPGGGVAWASGDALHHGGITLSPVRHEGGRPRPVREIHDVAQSEDGSLYLLDARGRELLRFDPDGSFRGVVAEPGRGVDVEVDGRGWVYLLDAQARTVTVHGPEGTLEARFGPVGEGYRLESPAALAVDPAYHIFVLERRSGTVLTFDTAGRLLARLQPPRQGPGALREPRAMAVDRGGALVIYDARSQSLRRFH